jgi:hypothetical protein
VTYSYPIQEKPFSTTSLNSEGSYSVVVPEDITPGGVGASIIDPNWGSGEEVFGTGDEVLSLVELSGNSGYAVVAFLEGLEAYDDVVNSVVNLEECV